MKIYIHAKPKSKKEYLKKIDATHYTVAVNDPPVKGKANSAIIRSLARYFDIISSRVHILHGETSKQKIVEIPITVDEIEKRAVQKKLFRSL